MNTEKLKELALAATPGPWSVVFNNYEAQYEVTAADGKSSVVRGDERECNYIATANPAAILELIAERDELLTAIEILRDAWPDTMKHGEVSKTSPKNQLAAWSQVNAIVAKAKAGAV